MDGGPGGFGFRGFSRFRRTGRHRKGSIGFRPTPTHEPARMVRVTGARRLAERKSYHAGDSRSDSAVHHQDRTAAAPPFAFHGIAPSSSAVCCKN